MKSALVVCAAPLPHSEEFYGRLIRRHEGLLIGVDGGAGLCLANARVPDVLVGDFDSITPEVLERTTGAGATVIRAPVDKDVTDLDLALDAASDVGAQRVVITAAWSGRIDHTLAAVGSIFAYGGVTIDLVDPGMTGCILDSRRRDAVTLSGPGATFSLFTIERGAVASCEGARYELTEATLDPLSSRGLSNELLDTPAVVRAVKGRLLVVSHAIDGIDQASISQEPA